MHRECPFQLYRPNCMCHLFRTSLVPRHAHLKHIANQRFTLISAPAGFGKTTLVVQWLQQINRPTAWLSIDTSHNNPKVFGAYLVHALHQLDGVINEALLLQVQSPQPPALDEVIVQIINHIASVSIQPILVLDDLHLISEDTSLFVRHSIFSLPINRTTCISW